MLNDLFHSIKPKDFFDNFWSKKHCVFSAANKLSSDFNINRFFDIIQYSKVNFPQLVCLNNNGQVPHKEYIELTPRTVSSRICPKKIIQLSELGNTIRIQRISEFAADLEQLRRYFAKAFDTPAYINGYYSKENSCGINAHFDIRHTFVIQIQGEKEWEIGQKTTGNPRYDCLDDLYLDSFVPNGDKFTLKAGEILYLPPGLWHRTKTKDHSLHLSVGVAMPDWYDFLCVYLESIMQKHVLLREQLPFEIVEDKLCFSQNLKNQHRNLIELLKNDVQKFKWQDGIRKILSKKS